MSRSKKKLSEYSPAKRLWLGIVFAVSLAIVAVGERDIQRRPAEQVRGSKLFWRLVCLNALGTLGYFRWGRRPSPAAADK